MAGMAAWWGLYTARRLHGAKALLPVADGWRIYMQGVAQVPQVLLGALCARAQTLHGVRLYHLHTEGPTPQLDPSLRGRLRDISLFVGANVRDAVNRGDADYLPVHLSEAEALFRSGRIPLAGVLVQVSPPDAQGLVSLGLSVEAVRGAMEAARYVVAQVNSLVPRTRGDALLPVECFDAFVEADEPIFSIERRHAASGIIEALGRHVAALVEDGSCLQLGIGAVPDAVAPQLRGRVGLGIHTEMFSDGLMELMEAGAADGRAKSIDSGLAIASFVEGSRRLYAFVADNPAVVMRSLKYTNAPRTIRRNRRVVAVNSALQVDLTGQVVAESLGPVQWSGVGGQVDFLRGAALAPEGRAVVALPSTARTASATISRIVRQLNAGAVVTTTRARADYVVTEHGIADLRGKTLAERAAALIAVAHPAYRDALAEGRPAASLGDGEGGPNEVCRDVAVGEAEQGHRG